MLCLSCFELYSRWVPLTIAKAVFCSSLCVVAEHLPYSKSLSNKNQNRDGQISSGDTQVLVPVGT